MPISVDVDRDQRLLCFRIVGDWDTREMMTCANDGLRRIQGEPGYDILSDHRDIGRPATPEEIQMLIELLSSASELRGRRAAMVTLQPASYGMLRLLAARAEAIGIEVGVFSDIEAARTFLRPPKSAAPD